MTNMPPIVENPPQPTAPADLCKWHQTPRPCDMCGRPTVMTPDTFTRLEEAFATGSSVEEACYYADVSEPTFYRFCKENQEFREHLYRLQHKPILLARKKVVESLSSDARLAFEFLQKKRPQEFAGEKMTLEFGPRSDPKNNDIEEFHPEDREAMRVAFEASVRARIQKKREAKIVESVPVEVATTPQ